MVNFVSASATVQKMYKINVYKRVLKMADYFFYLIRIQVGHNTGILTELGMRFVSSEKKTLMSRVSYITLRQIKIIGWILLKAATLILSF